MEKNKFLAAAYYDYVMEKERGDTGIQPATVVIDADENAFGICNRSKEGEVQVLAHMQVPAPCPKSVAELLGETEKQAMQRLSELNRMLQRYYRSNRCLDMDLGVFLGKEMKCSEFAALFDPVKTALELLANAIEAQLTKTGLSQEELHIVVIGKKALFYPTMYYIKSAFTFDAFLRDERFVNGLYPDAADRIVEIGQCRYESDLRMLRTLRLKLTGPNGTCDETFLCALKGDEVSYFGPIFCEKEEGLQVHYKQAAKKMDFPNTFFTKPYEMLEIGAYLKAAMPVLRIRKYDKPECVCDIPMNE